jgi:hypothetical protein
MFITVLKSLGMLMLCCVSALACAASQPAQEASPPLWSMLIDTSTPKFSTQEAKLRERMTRCSAGKAVIHRDTGMTQIGVAPLKSGSCQWSLSIEIEGHTTSFVCAPPIGTSPLPSMLISRPSPAELARLRCGSTDMDPKTGPLKR